MIGFGLRQVQFLFYIDQEIRLVAGIMLYARRGFPFTPKQLCVLAYEMAVREGRTGFSPIKKRAGRTWLKYFFHRNSQVKTKMSQNLSICHAMGVNKVQINKFFDQLKD